MEKLVSIIMPAYNAEKFIEESIRSVMEQLYEKWELFVIDDCSQDRTPLIVKDLQNEDKRIHYYKMETNSGAALARNKGISFSNGAYIAFLDSDDVWSKEKLLKQISFMESNNISFSCTYYNLIDENGIFLDRIIKYKSKASYNDLLKSCPGNSTVIYKAEAIGKVYAENMKRRNDYVMWFKVIKRSGNIYCLDEVLTSYRKRNDSISSNKLKLVKYHWYIYRRVEKLSFFKSLYLVIYWCYKGVKRGREK